MIFLLYVTSSLANSALAQLATGDEALHGRPPDRRLGRASPGHWPHGGPAAGRHVPCSRARDTKFFFDFAHKKPGFTETSFKTMDKVTTHTYETMYGMFVAPLRFATHKVRLFEIGLGCGHTQMSSHQVWRNLLPGAEIWEGEYNASCVAEHAETLERQGVNVVTGDQADAEVLRNWKARFGPKPFDVIIDDGGHMNSQIGASFDALWQIVKPGGIYVVEDLAASRGRKYVDSGPENIFMDKVLRWADSLATYGHGQSPSDMPRDISFVFVQRGACVIGKRFAVGKVDIHDFDAPP